MATTAASASTAAASMGGFVCVLQISALGEFVVACIEMSVDVFAVNILLVDATGVSRFISVVSVCIYIGEIVSDVLVIVLPVVSEVTEVMVEISSAMSLEATVSALITPGAF